MSLSSSQSHAADVQNAHVSPAQTASSSSPPSFPISLNRTPVTVTATNSFPTPASSICGRAAANTNASMDEGGDLNLLPADAHAHEDNGSVHHNDNSKDDIYNGNRQVNGDMNVSDDPMDCDPTAPFSAQVARPTNHDRQAPPSPQQSPNLQHGQPPSPPSQQSQSQSQSQAQSQPQPQIDAPTPAPAAADSTPAPFTAEFGKMFNLCKRSKELSLAKQLELCFMSFSFIFEGAIGSCCVVFSGRYSTLCRNIKEKTRFCSTPPFLFPSPLPLSFVTLLRFRFAPFCFQ